jgi:hypothetical protein
MLRLAAETFVSWSIMASFVSKIVIPLLIGG